MKYPKHTRDFPMRVQIKSASWTCGAPTGPTAVLACEDALGEPVTLKVVGVPPVVEARLPPATELPRDADMLEHVMDQLNSTLAARYRHDCIDEMWCCAVKRGEDTPALVRGWRVEERTLFVEMAHPAHMQWARSKLGAPGGRAFRDQPAKPWLDTALVARLWRPDAPLAQRVFSTSGDDRYEALVMRKIGTKVGEWIDCPDDVRTLAVSAIKPVPKATKRKRGAPPETAPAAPAVPDHAATWSARRGLSTVTIRTAAGRGWAIGTGDTLAALVAAGWRPASVSVGSTRHKGAYAARLPDDHTAPFAVGWTTM